MFTNAINRLAVIAIKNGKSRSEAFKQAYNQAKQVASYKALVADEKVKRIHFRFVKKDGSLREAVADLSQMREYVRKTNMVMSAAYHRYFDLTCDGWRQFAADRFLEIIGYYAD
ncbi:MAG: DUF2693 domain-containing protein [Muribaculaceae bacterium]|nr:DUF2693 domain-containing protein [Muribaculaceae bacterium]